MSNAEHDDHYLDITTQICKAIINPPIPVVNKVSDDVNDMNEAPKDESEKLVTNGEL